MKLKISEEKKTNFILAGALLLFAILLYFIVQNVDALTQRISGFLGLLMPFLLGLGLAYILWRPMRFFQKLLDKIKLGKSKKALPRGVTRAAAIIFIFVLLGLAISLIGMFIVPQLKQSLLTLYWKMPSFVQSLQESAENLMDSFGFKGNVYEILTSLVERFWGTISAFVSNAVPAIVNASLNITSGVINTVLAVVVSVYILFSKEKFAGQVKKLCCAVLPGKTRGRLFRAIHIFDDTFGGYINGQLTDAVVVGTLCFLLMLLLRLPFALLVAVIVMITNVIPMIGPFIGAVPSAFIILMAGGPVQMLIFIVMILVLQQIDGNILVPRIVGNSTGLSGFWVLFAIMVGGGLFGFVGIVLCVPTLSVILKITKILVEKRLEKEGYPTASEDYVQRDLTQ